MDLPPLRPPPADFDPVRFASSPQGVALAVLLVVLALLLIVVASSLMVRRRRTRRVRSAPLPTLDEDLSAYPPPGKAGSQRLTVRGVPVRLRLVVLAPLGR